MRVKIKKYKDPSFWYANSNKLGETLNVRDCYSLDGYGVSKEFSYLDFFKEEKSGNLIFKEDCEIIPEQLELFSKEDSRVFETGAKRDSDSTKPFVHSLKGYTRLRFGYRMTDGANKYGDGNWEKGIPTESYIKSNDRHWAMYIAGDRSEDHLAAIIFNTQGIMLNEEKEGIKADYYFKNRKND